MKYSLRLLLLLGGWLLLGNPMARASHAQGGQLTYEYVGTATLPNRYRVTCRFMRDCSGIDAPTSLTLNCRVGTSTTACTSTDSRNFTATLVRGVLTTGTPYCTSTGNACSSAGRPNYETAKYEAVVTLPPAASWTLSVQENARPALANITGGSQDLYLEATLNNQITLASGTTQTINNTSAQYFEQQAPTSFVCYQQRNTVSFLATEPDGDSLVYSLPAVQEGCNQPMTYKPTGFNSTTPIFDPSSTPQNPCLIYPSGLPQNYSAAYPIASYEVTGNCPARQVTPLFQFNPRQGTFTFRPALYDATNPANNKYTVVGKVTEYRRINGRYYQVGSVRRDIMVIVMDCGTNGLPGAVSSATPAAAAPDSLVVTAPYLGSSTVNFTFTDSNPNDVLTLTHTLPTDPLYASLYVNPSSPGLPITLTNNGSTSPVLQVRLRPDADVVGRTFRIPVRLEDNACPAKGVQNYVLVLRVTGNATATRPAARLLYSAYPNPFSEQVHFTLPRRAGQVDIVDQLGRVVDRLPVPAGAAAETELTWTPRPTLPAGVYTARSADGTQVVRLVRVQP
ncbi:T9SS type A sorting domain-containing protein [Hymenobacter sp. 15J16-1T3B]|uniref:T9SS type A sorting domain-containing protein n=1 Tax=Hymenobacter sp. 15J16-1T3B TaxID=2886941 RepID=UPI001D1244C5|nr:T9SS type A sorting domain-containing protein [Hymenobacter sp. 15J16-1T3B]MCC3156620.1 T9SS type A sorting domain-containing protein [Hymenobacter sp. 15J16-1T3B]